MSVEVSRLKNGITVVTQEMPHLESVALGVWVGAGGRSEAKREHGISHLLEHMAFKGTTRRSARDIAEAIEAVGGDMNAETSVEHTTYYLRLLKGDVALGMDVLGDILCNPRLDPDELVLEQHVILQEIGAAHDVPDDWVFELFQEAAFPDQPLGRSILGTPESIRAHTAEDLRLFLDAHYCGPRTVIAGAGNLDHGTIARLAEENFAALPARMSTAPERASYRGGESREPRPLKEVQTVLGFPAPSFLSRTFAAAHVYSSILGGGMASRLFQEAREKRGLCYSIYSFYWPFMDTGLLGIHAATSEDDVRKLVPVILDELRKMTRVDAVELARAKAQMRAGLLMTLESPIARVGQMARHVLVHGRPLTLEETVARVDAVTLEDLSVVAEAVLTSAPTCAAIGPRKVLPRIDDVIAGIGRQHEAVN
jgi:predicted Zn-dependent peptidase